MISLSRTPGNHPRLAVLCFFPDWGHVQPLIRIGAAAAASGWAVRCYLPERARALADRLEIEARYLDDVARPEVLQLFRKLSRWPLLLRQYSGHAHANLGITPQAYDSVIRCLPGIENDIREFNPQVVLSDYHLFRELYARIANDLNAAHITHNPSGTLAPAQRTYIQLFGYDGTSQNMMGIVERFGQIFELLFKRFYYIFHGADWIRLRRLKKQLDCLSEELFPSALANLRSEEITTSLSWIEQKFLGTPPHPYLTRSFAPLGVLHDSVDSNLEAWFESASEPVIYVSFGSMVSLSGANHKNLIQRLAATGHRVLWSAPVEEHASLIKLTDGNSSFLFRAYVPQSRVLARPDVVAFITHAGANSVLEALVGGTPMVCVPFFADQPYIASIVQQLGTGRTVKKRDLGSPRLSAALYEVLGEKVQNRSSELRNLLSKGDGTDLLLKYLGEAHAQHCVEG